ncbi:MAG: hypothetical protein KDD25_03120 [Bdellovibrionales bacterium]|nr:hypothetical protein [Bdellovibrionales bacterium]
MMKKLAAFFSNPIVKRTLSILAAIVAIYIYIIHPLIKPTAPGSPTATDIIMTK